MQCGHDLSLSRRVAGMEITLQYFESCPHWNVVESRLKAIIDEHRLDANLSYQPIETPEEAEKLSFVGSPTVLIDGTDPFAPETPVVGLACRTYFSTAGRGGSPLVAQLERALGV